jgi:cytochrome c biogenesis protein CcdA
MAYFLMPYLGGLLIAFGAGFGLLFYVAAGFVSLSLAFIMNLSRRQKKPGNKEGVNV